MSVQGKVVVITGSGSGLGREAALLFASKGAKVVVADYNLEAAKLVQEEIVRTEGFALAVRVNVSNKDSVDNMVKEIISEYEKVDILINNAGVTADARLIKMTEDQWDKVIDTNLKGVFLCTNAVAKLMTDQKFGRIINTASISAGGNFGQTNYAASKAGVIAMTKTWSKELGGYGVTVNAVAPGFIETPMTQGMKQEVLDKLAQKVPAGQLGKPIEIAHAYLFLASEESAYINGSVLEVNGGLTL